MITESETTPPTLPTCHVELRVFCRIPNEALVVLMDLLCCDGEDDGVFGAGEGVDAVVGHVGRVVDASVGEHLVGVGDESVHTIIAWQIEVENDDQIVG